LWLAVLCGLARACGKMKAFSKRGSSVLDAPEEMYAPEIPEVPWAASGSGTRNPAPAGALQRAYSGSYSVTEEETEQPHYIPVRGKVRFRLRGIVRTVTGRVVLGVALFLGLCATAAAIYTVRNYLLHDERFVIAASEQIETVGNTHLTRAQLLSVFGEDVERNIFKVPLAERRADLERLPWVQHAIVMRLLPNTLRISVVERTPVAFVRQGSSIGLVDASGVLLDMPSNVAGDPHYSFPVLTGLSAVDPLSTRAARVEIYRHFMADLDSSGEKVTENLSEVDVSNPEDVKAVIPSGGTDILVHFGDEDFLQRYRHFQEHLPEWKQQYPKLLSADMRYDRQVVLDTGGVTAKPASTTEDHAADATTRTPAKPLAKAPPSKAPAAHASHRPTVKPVSEVRTKTAAGRKSSGNAKMFAALAAARRQQSTHSARGPQ
jgi:cell division protein FtsQ